MNKLQKAEQAEAIDRLRKMLKPGDTVHTILRHVSRSGMQRAISLITIHEDGPHTIDWLVRLALDMKFDRNHAGLKVVGCGMDMGFDLVYNLSRTLFQGRFKCSGKGCPSNDHANPPYPKRRKNGRQHSDGGYALNHRWL